MSGCAMACRALDALIQMIGHCHEPSRRHMLRDQPRRSEEPSVPFGGPERRTGSGIMLQSLLARLSRLDRRVGNDVSFIFRYCTPSDSKGSGNGGGVPVFGTYVPWIGTHPLNRNSLRRLRGRKNIHFHI